MRFAHVLVVVAACGYPQPARAPDAAAGSDAKPVDGGIDGAGVTHKVAASWEIGPVGGNPTGCPSPYTAVVLTSQQVDANGQAIGAAVIDTFACTQTAGASSPLQPARYQVSLAVTDPNTQTTYATSLPATLDLTTADQTYTTQIYTDGGYFQLRWTLVGAASMNTLTCAQAGAPTVEVISTNSADPTKVSSDVFDCNAGQGITAGLAAAVYTVNIGANNAQMQSLGNVTLSNEQIGSPNRVTNLGPVTIPIANM